MTSFPMPSGAVVEPFHHLDPPMGTGVTPQPDSTCVVTRDGQCFALADQGTTGLKQFFQSIPTCLGTSPESIRSWYNLLTKMAATTGFYIHPYFCFRKDADSDYGFTCGFDTGPITVVTYCAEVLHRPYAPVVPAQLHVPADSSTGAAEILAQPAVPEVLEIAHVPERLAVPASDAVWYDLPGLLQPRLPVWTSQISVAFSRGNVFKKGTPQYTLLHQNTGNGYAALFQIIQHSHPTLSRFPLLEI